MATHDRQFDNFMFYFSFPSVVVVTNVCGLLVVWQLYYMDNHSCKEDTFLKSRNKYVNSLAYN